MENAMDKVISLCKRRGFIFPNSEIYGGIQGFYDYGQLGVELKNNIKRVWWKWMIQEHENIVGIDGAIITHPRVWEASGHIQNFIDPLVECKSCHKRFRADHIVGDRLERSDQENEKDRLRRIDLIIKENNIRCPDCQGQLTQCKKFSQMVETSLGVIEGEKRTAYLKAEACQTIYLDYENVLQSSRYKIPFGIVQIGKAFRNEITPGHFTYRLKEFEQWDLQWFTNPKEMDKWYDYWRHERLHWYQNLINHKENIRLRQHTSDELAHYAKIAFDIEYKTPWGWSEWEGIHWRGDWDLSRHGKFSGKDFTYTDPKTGEKFIPWIVETSGGVDRTLLYILIDAYTEEKINVGTRVVLKLRPDLAPYKVAVFPLVANKKEIVGKAHSIYKTLKPVFMTDWDDLGNIGKRYRRQDEIGTPYCITVDYETLKDDTVTIRNRDFMRQERVPMSKLIEYINGKLNKKQRGLFDPNEGKKLDIKVDKQKFIRIPVETDVFRSGDDFAVKIAESVKVFFDKTIPNLNKQNLEEIDFHNKKWFLAVTEKIVAIPQGRSYFIWDIKPSLWANFLSTFVTKTSYGIGLGSPWTMQIAINEIGLHRILFASFASIISKPFGIKGLFYRLVGSEVASIDGPTSYSLYPSNVSAKLGPKHPQRCTEQIQKEIAASLIIDKNLKPKLSASNFLGVAIIDGNDLGQKVLGNSTQLTNELIEKIFEDNPMGQADEQTPITLVFLS